MPNPVVIYKLIDLALDALAIGLERSVIIDGVRAQEAAGKTPDEIADYLKNLRDEALAKAESAVR